MAKLELEIMFVKEKENQSRTNLKMEILQYTFDVRKEGAAIEAIWIDQLNFLFLQALNDRNKLVIK